MSVLTVDRLTATLHDPPGPLRAGLPQAAAAELERVWDRVRVPAGRWCVRRLDVLVRLDRARPTADPTGQWAAAVAVALQDALHTGRRDVVRFRHELDALADLVGQLCLGRTERAWAWRQLGLLRDGDPAPPREALLTALGRTPEWVVPALVRALPRCGVAAADRRLGAVGWARLAALALPGAWASAAVLTSAALPARGGVGDDHTAARGGGSGDGRVAGRGGAPAGAEGSAAYASWIGSFADRHRAAALVAGSELAALLGRARLRPPPATLAAWAALVVAEADPQADLTPGARPADPGVLVAVVALLAAEHGVPDPRRSAVGPPPTDERAAAPLDPDRSGASAARARFASSPDRSAAARRSDQSEPPPAARLVRPAAPARPADPARLAGRAEPDEVGAVDDPGLPTDWAGLAFLLATAADAGLPGAIDSAPALVDRPRHWVLLHVGRAMAPVAADDPALLALAGLDLGRAARLARLPAPTAAEQAALAALGRSWIAATDARLAVADPPVADPAAARPAAAAPGDRVRRLMRRPGRVLAEPGWVEVHLALTGVDPAVRRAGLDLDPGWVSWLGAVVRYVYE